MGYLGRVFSATERENCRTILATLPAARGGALLDLGTHDGSFAVRVAERLGSDEAVGVELIDAHAVLARERGLEMVVADVEQGLPFADARFDVVHANQVIEHVRGTDLFLSEIRRVMKPGGLACISTNNLASWHNVVSLAFGFQPMPMHVSDEVILGNPLNPEQGDPHLDGGRVHIRLFTGRSLTELCAHHRLRRIALQTTGYYPLPPWLVRRAVRLDPLHGAFLIGLFEPA
jgi:SAM-dependent methyltransferase